VNKGTLGEITLERGLLNSIIQEFRSEAYDPKISIYNFAKACLQIQANHKKSQPAMKKRKMKSPTYHNV
jgi:hypothetical protein